MVHVRVLLDAGVGDLRRPIGIVTKLLRGIHLQIAQS